MSKADSKGVSKPSAPASGGNQGAARVAPGWALAGEAAAGMSVVDSRSFWVAPEAKDEQGSSVLRALRLKNPNVMFVVARSCNANVVVYEGRIDRKHPKRLDPKEPVDIYWLNLEDKYRIENRNKGVPHDRDELSWAERRLGYGAKSKADKGLPGGTFRLRMNAHPSLFLHMGVDPRSNRPRAVITLDPAGKLEPGDKRGSPCVLDRIFVHVVWRHRVQPDVDWLVYHGTDLASQLPVQHKVVRALAR
jgi:hypothetical protein